MRWDRNVRRWRNAAGRFLPIRPPLEIILIDEPDAQFEAGMAEVAATVLEHHQPLSETVMATARADHHLVRRDLVWALFRSETR